MKRMLHALRCGLAARIDGMTTTPVRQTHVLPVAVLHNNEGREALYGGGDTPVVFPVQLLLVRPNEKSLIVLYVYGVMSKDQDSPPMYHSQLITAVSCCHHIRSR